jgi:outer membrane protein OmpA-like peptidoglycan-associated protein
VAPDFETLVFDPNAGTVAVTKAPPPKTPDYAEPVYTPPPSSQAAKPLPPLPKDYAVKKDPTYVPPVKKVALPSVAVTIEFDFDSDQVRASEFFRINDLIAAFSDPALQGTAYAVIGHTDAKGSESYNCNLSLRRAASVTRLLENSYVPVALYPVGFGEFVLKNEYDPRAAENRRVTFLRLPHDARAVLQTAGSVCNY